MNEMGKLKFLHRVWRMRESGIIIPTLLLCVVIQIVNPVFLSFSNAVNIFRATGFTLITALGMTFVFIAGGLELSVGSVLALGGVVAAMTIKAGVPLVLAIPLGCGVGLAVGMFNGFIIEKFRIPSLIVTLGMLYMARGIVYILTTGVPVYPLPAAFQKIEQTELWGIPTIVILSMALALVAHVVLARTTFGRRIYAVGGNREAARLSGIRGERVSIWVYAITGALAALTGILMAARLGSAQPGAGTGFELTVIAAVIIGGTSMFGGSGTILGTAVGALFMNILSNGMTLMKVSVYWQNLIVGAILVLAVIVDQTKRKRMAQL